MKALDSCKLIGISLLFAVGLAACDKPGQAENAGKKIDQMADNAGKKMSDAADKAGEKIGNAADKLGANVSVQNEKAAAALADAEITAKVKAAIFAEPGLKTLQISVDTVKGGVTLTGSVDSPANSSKAGALAGAVAGVTKVENRLVVILNSK